MYGWLLRLKPNNDHSSSLKWLVISSFFNHKAHIAPHGCKHLLHVLFRSSDFLFFVSWWRNFSSYKTTYRETNEEIVKTLWTHMEPSVIIRNACSIISLLTVRYQKLVYFSFDHINISLKGARTCKCRWGTVIYGGTWKPRLKYSHVFI